MNSMVIASAREAFVNLAKKSKDIIAVTGNLGVDFLTPNKFYEGALEASQQRKSVTRNDIIWTPIEISKKIIVVYGIKNGLDAKVKISGYKKAFNEFLDTEFLKQNLVDDERMKSDFVIGLLLKDRIKTMDQAIDQADILGVNLRSAQAIMKVRVPGLSDLMRQSRETQEGQYGVFFKKLSKYFDNFEANIFTCLANDVFIFLKSAHGEVNTKNTIKFFREKANYLSVAIEKETGIKPTIGVGQYYPGLSGLRKSYSDADTALEVGRRLWGEGKNYHILDIGMLVSLSEDLPFERKCELAFQILGPVLKDEDLYKTVTIFLDCNMSLSEAAPKLHLHRNTLIYRLEKIKKSIGLDPRNFSDAVKIKLGLILYGPSIRCYKES